jgi:peptidyl-prolyl cis-trans isomerase A (cyclophilin A)
MLRRLVLSMVLMLGLTAAAPPPPSAPPPPAPALVGVAINTQLGTITLALDAQRAPATTANFLRYVDQRRFDGTAFYRAMKLNWGEQPNGLIQGGTQMDPKRILKPIAHEPTSQTGILHKAGAISMARYAPGTATGDFSILLSDMPGLDAAPSSENPDQVAGFAAFGNVVAGMDVVRRIFAAPVSPTAGQGVMKGEMLEPKVRILTMRRVALPAPTPAPAPAETPRAP